MERAKDKVKRLQNVDELHIEIDVLSQTPPGIEQLRTRLQKLRQRLAFQQSQYDRLSDDFMQAKPQLSQLRHMIEHTQKTEEHIEAMKFEIARLHPVQERCLNKRETLES